MGSKVTPPKILCDVTLEMRKKQVISFDKRTEMYVSWHNSLLRTIVRFGIVKERLGDVIMKRQNASKSKKEKKPPISRNPIVFETAFEKRLGQTPVDYLVNKIQGGSDISSIEYLFDIISAEIAMKNHCVYRSVKR